MPRTRNEQQLRRTIIIVYYQVKIRNTRWPPNCLSTYLEQRHHHGHPVIFILARDYKLMNSWMDNTLQRHHNKAKTKMRFLFILFFDVVRCSAVESWPLSILLSSPADGNLVQHTAQPGTATVSKKGVDSYN